MIKGWMALLACLASISAVPVAAGPWAEPGDRQLRQDVELLKAAGVIRGPVNSWPLPWAQIAENLDQVSPATLPSHVAVALRRVQTHAGYAEEASRFRVRLQATNQAALIRDFGTHARSDSDVSVRAEHDLGRLTIGYGVGYRDGQRGRDMHFEPSYAALRLGNWALYGGYVDTWWGPGHDGALLFSTASRPFPRVGIKRLNPEPFKLPVLKWLGPWRLDMFAGVATEKRNDFNNPAMIGLRFAFEPVHGLEIGLNRGLQLCGAGRPCGLKTVGTSLLGFGNADNSGTFNEPGNQIAGFDFSYTRMVGQVTAQVYAEAEAEDEWHFIDLFSRLAGLKISTPLGENGTTLQVGAEVADTLAYNWTKGRRFPGTMYWNFIYRDGWTYRGGAVGHSVGGDSKIISLYGSLTDASHRRYYGSLRKVSLNRLGASSVSLSETPENIRIATGGVELPTYIGDIRLEGRVMDNRVNTPGRDQSQIQIELGWTSRF